MNDNKKLSIITICYDEPGVEQTCESIVNQTWQDFEWIVIDGGSNEETLNIFEKYKYRIDKFVSEKDNGIYDACNKGVKLATGEYLNFMNAGDKFYSIDVLEKVFKTEYSQDILYGDTCFICEQEYKYIKKPEDLDTKFWVNSNINTQSSFIKKYLFDTYGYHDDKNYKIAADFDRWMLFRSKGATFAHIPYIIACFNKNGISGNKKNHKILQNEKNNILLKYYSKYEINKNKKKKNIKFINEQIFSLKNSKDNRHKIITILGIHIKIKNNNPSDT